MSNRDIKKEGTSMGACPLEDHDSSSKQTPPLTLSQKLQIRRTEISKRNTEIITKFIAEQIEPLLEDQVNSGLSKTVYLFIPSDSEQKDLTNLMPENKNIVEGFGGREKSGPYISKVRTTEYVKVTRLIAQEYGLEFWEQSTVMKELKERLKLRLQVNGEKLAETTLSPEGLSWPQQSFLDGSTLPPGYTAVELSLNPSKICPDVTIIQLYVEIT